MASHTILQFTLKQALFSDNDCVQPVTASPAGGVFTADVNLNAQIKVKVKDSRNRPGVAQRVPGGLGSQIFMTFST